MPFCAVKWCGKSSNTSNLNKDGITFHRFPKCPNMKQKWINATKRDENWFPKTTTVICSRHFTEDCFRLTKTKRRLLFSNAVPTLMLPSLASSQDYSFASGSVQLTTVEKSSITNSPQNDLAVPSTSDLPAEISIETSDIPAAFNTPRKKRLFRTIIDLSQKLKKKNKIIKRLQDSNRILKRKVKSLKLLLEELEKKQLITKENSTILNSIGVKCQELIKRQILSAKTGKISRKKYSPELRTFALTLNFYSPKAYQYVRKIFNTCLPSVKTISKWYKTVDGRPGFTKEAFDALKLKSEHSQTKFYGALIFDEMKIKSKVEYVPITQRTHGYVDFGSGLQTDCIEECTEALVFLVVPFNGMFKVPIGFFLVNKVTAHQKANLVRQAIQMCSEVNFIIKAVTFDGCPTNIAMAKNLGCDFESSSLKSTFSTNDTEIAVFLDPVHMIKLVRNSFEFYKNFIDSQGNVISWSFIQKLHELQENESFHMANKLRAEHLNFKNNIMKVKLATQLFSRSVATALLFCDSKLHINDFKNVAATANMIMIINDLFDILDSKTHGYGYKRAMNNENYPEIVKKINEAKSFLMSLRTRIVTKTSERIVKLIESPRFTGFIGLCICIESLKFLYNDIIKLESCPLHYLPVHKISQDHIELFFCNVRSIGRANDNPTPRQFEAVYKKMLIHTELQQSGSGNCIPLENITILNCSSSIDRINMSAERIRGSHATDYPESGDNNFVQALQHITMSLFSENIIEYIAGFVVNSLMKKIQCNKCLHALISLTEKSNSLIYARDKGGLIYPSDSVIKICRRSEVVIRSSNFNEIKPVHRVTYITTKTLQSLSNEQLFSELLQHQFDYEYVNHLVDLIKSVINKYVDVRLTYLTKKTSYKSVRRVYTKLIHFKGQ